MRDSRFRHLLAAATHHIRERPCGHAEPARHHHRPGRHVQPGQRRTQNHAVARDRRRGGTHHDRGRAGGHGGETGVRHNAPAKRRQRADGRHLGARDRRAGPPTPSNGFFGGDVYNAASLLLSEDWITARHRRLGGRGLQRHRHAGRRALARVGQPRQHRRRRLGRDPEPRLGRGVQRPCVPARRPSCSSKTRRSPKTTRAWVPASSAGPTTASPTATHVSVINSTIADNSTKSESSGGARGPGGGLLISDGTAQVAGSILAYNSETVENFTNTNCSTSGSGTIVSLGYNLETEADCGFKSTGDLQNQLSKFGFTSGEPQNNGGNTDTLALEPTSPGVDAIPTSIPVLRRHRPARRQPSAGRRLRHGRGRDRPVHDPSHRGITVLGPGRDQTKLRHRNPGHAHDRMGRRAEIERDGDGNGRKRQPHLSPRRGRSTARSAMSTTAANTRWPSRRRSPMPR